MMLIKKHFFEITHHVIILILPILFIILPLVYIKYVAWIPLAVAFSWIIFNGCIMDKLHHDNANIGIKLTDNVTPILKLFNKKLANYINKKYLQNTNRASYIMFFYFILIITIACYRLIYNIDFINI
jgi:hypothetical protein